MFDQPGIGIEDIAWIQRDQFVYYLEMEHQLGDPADWPRFRRDLLEALQAAFGPGIDEHAVLSLLDRLHAIHDPRTDWAGFRRALWDERRQIRPDLSPTG